jgi:hypothetical protein
MDKKKIEGLLWTICLGVGGYVGYLIKFDFWYYFPFMIFLSFLLWEIEKEIKK